MIYSEVAYGDAFRFSGTKRLRSIQSILIYSVTIIYNVTNLPHKMGHTMKSKTLLKVKNYKQKGAHV